MPDREYAVELDEAAREWLRVRLTTESGRVVAFTIQYETTIADARIPVVRYDSAHDRPHRDLLDHRGQVVAKQWIEGVTYGEALDRGRTDLLANWPHYRDDFLRRRDEG